MMTNHDSSDRTPIQWVGWLLLLVVKCVLGAVFIVPFMVLREGERYFRRTVYDQGGILRRVVGILSGLATGIGIAFHLGLKVGAHWAAWGLAWYPIGLVLAASVYAYGFPAIFAGMRLVVRTIAPKLLKVVKIVWCWIRNICDSIRRVVVFVWEKFCEFMRFVGRQIRRLAIWVWDWVTFLWVTLCDAIEFVARKLGRGIKYLINLSVRAWNALREALRSLGLRIWNILKPACKSLIAAFETTYKGPGQNLFLHASNVAVLGAGIFGGIYLVLLLSSWWAIGLASMGLIAGAFAAYLWVGSFLLRAGNWLIGGALAFLAAYFAGIGLASSGIGYAVGAAALSGAAVFLLIFPVGYSLTHRLLSGTQLEASALGLLEGAYQWSWNFSTGVREFLVELYINTRNWIVNTSYEVAAWATRLWYRLTGADKSDDNKSGDTSGA